MGTLIKATDFSALVQCDRLVYLEHHGDPGLCVEDAPYQRWVLEAGREHEAAVVERLGAGEPVKYERGDLEAGFEATLGLMRQGVALIYQGVLMHGDLVGIPDLLQRVEGGSRLGGYHYRPLDVKLASTVKEGDRLQVMAYIALLEAIQGVRPVGGLLLRVPPDERDDPHQTREEMVAFDMPLYEARMKEVSGLVGGYEPMPFISSVCGRCAWREHCTGIAERGQDVSLMPGLKRKVWRALHERGLGTLPAAAAASREELINIKGVGEKTALDIILRSRALSRGQSVQIGTPALPASDPAIFFDIESVPGEGVIYLMGLLIGRGDQYAYEYVLARSPEEEPHMWEAFLRRMDVLKGTVYHYGAYERTSLGRLVGRYGEDARVEALLARMVDLRKVLRSAVVLPLRSSSLKDVAPWLGYEWTGETQAADDSMLEYIRWLEDGQEERLERILEYNEHDCRATARVYEWLRSLVEEESG
jgi:predicted RecB family nuclease